jgi:hypothetical protein
MYTVYIISLLIFVVLSCVFGSKRTNPGARLIIGSTMLVSIIISLIVITNLRLDLLEQEIIIDESLQLSGVTYSSDTVYYKIDTVKNGPDISINKVKTIKDSSNHNEVESLKSLITFKDSTYMVVITDGEEGDDEDFEDMEIESMCIIIDDSDTTNRVYVKTLEYIPDDWTAWYIPTIKEWKELHISNAEYKKAYSLYPELFKQESLNKLHLYYATL